MTKQEKEAYQTTEALRQFLTQLHNQKFSLDCGHHVTFGTNLGSNVMILNGRKPTIICSLCSY